MAPFNYILSQFKMDFLKDDIDQIRKKLLLFANTRINQNKYPFCTFLMGMLYHRVRDISTVKTFVENLEFLNDTYALSQHNELKILNAALTAPELIPQLQSNILDKLAKMEPVGVDCQIKRLLVDQSKKEQPNNNPSHEQQNQATQEIPLSDHTQELSFADEEEQQRKKKQSEDQKQTMLLIQKLRKQQEMSKSANEATICEICTEDLYEQQFAPFTNCLHVFHVECVKRYFQNSISIRKFPLVCPKDGCSKQIVNRDIMDIIDSKIYAEYMDMTFKNYVDNNNDTVSWCPTADCKHVFFYTNDDEPEFECPECKKTYCLRCRVEWHKKMTCKEFQVSNTFSDDDQKFLNFVRGAKFKQCPKCKFWVQKNMGCDHMSCRCGNQFCYKCGGKYGDCQCVRQAREQMLQQQQRLKQKREAAARRKQEKMMNPRNSATAIAATKSSREERLKKRNNK